ncbi:MAG: glycosyltransferase [Methanomicrobiales archaeon]|nr:glycosyltransferase [Methanomicrobiales archaeon]
MSAARNRGIEAARVDFIAFLDADDEWMPTHLGALLRLRGRYPRAGAYGTAYRIKGAGLTIQVPSVDVDGIPPEPWEGLLPNYFRAAFPGPSPLSSSAVAVPKTVLNEMGGFNTDAWYGEDVDVWGRIALKYPIAFTRDGMAIYHKAARNRACDRKEPIQEHTFVTSAREALQAGEVTSALREDLLEYVASRQIQIAARNIEAGRPDLARKALKDCRTRRLRKYKYRVQVLAYIPSSVYLAISTLRSKFRGA